MDPNQFFNGMNAINNSKTRAEQARTRQELEEFNRRAAIEEQKPKCPVCGGRIERGYEKCQHCTESLVWYGGFPGKKSLGLEALKNQVEQKRERDLKAQALKEKREEEAIEEARRNAQWPLHHKVIFCIFLVYAVWLVFANLTHKYDRQIAGSGKPFDLDGIIWHPWQEVDSIEKMRAEAEESEREFRRSLESGWENSFE